MTRVNTAIVIGGGIAGPVAALALGKAGIEATVYEAYDVRAGDKGGIGGSIALASNGVAALDIVGVGQAVVAVAQPIKKQVMTVRGKTLALPSLPGVDPLRVVRRGDLHRILGDAVRAAGIRTETGRRLRAVREERDGVTAVFADGTEATADVLIGADGVHSTVRGLIDPAAPGPKYTGMLGFEGFSRSAVPEDPDTMVFAFGKQAYYLYWASPGGTTFGVNLPYQRPLSIREARAEDPERWMRTLLDVYGPDVPGGDLLRGLTPDELLVNGALFIMPSVPHWHRGRMVLTGDAVHAPSNSSGQGASLAIESAIELARCLRDVGDVGAAFATYEGLRRRRVEGVAARAARINRTKAPGPVAQAVMPILLPLVMRAAMRPEKVFGPEVRFRIDWERAAR